jgi:hypothetical protein
VVGTELRTPTHDPILDPVWDRGVSKVRVVHSKGRPLVSGMGMPGTPERADVAEGVRRASP